MMNTSRIFVVLGVTTSDITLNYGLLTEHWLNDRASRYETIVKNLGTGKRLASFRVDTGHRNGAEIHTIFSNGLILIQNEKTKKLVTELIARPHQITRYWEELGRAIPIEVYAVLPLARKHQMFGYNER